MRKSLLLIPALVATAAALIAPLTASATTLTSIQVAGAVRCLNGGHNVVGVWVNSSRGGSKFAKWRPSGYDGSPNSYAAYTATLSVPMTAGESTSIDIRVGCGGDLHTWGSTSRTKPITVAHSTLLSATCNNPSSPDHSDKIRCGIASNGSDSSAITAALSALSRLKDVSSVDKTGHRFYWSGYCTRFVGYSWGRADGGFDTAKDMYTAFGGQGAASKTGPIPVGALAFYELTFDESDWHVNIHIGLGVFISTMGSIGDHDPIIDYRVSQYQNSKRIYLGWIMPPATSWRMRDGYDMTTSSLICKHNLSGGGPGGVVSVTVRGNERRRLGDWLHLGEADLYRTVWVWTDGKWEVYSADIEPYASAHLRSAKVVGQWQVAAWSFDGLNPPTAPRIGARVYQSGTYRLTLDAFIYDSDGLLLLDYPLETVDGNCVF